MFGFIFFAAIIVAIGVFGFISCTYIIDDKKVHTCRTVYLFLSAAGFLSAVTELIVYCIKIGTYTGDDLQVIKDAFFIFLSVVTVLFGICFVITGISAFLKSKLQIFIPLICGLWSVFILFWTYLCTTWSAFPEFTLVPYIAVYGVSLCLVLLVPSLPVLFSRYKLISNKAEVQKIITDRKVKKETARLRKERKKLTAEKKKRLKNPKR